MSITCWRLLPLLTRLTHAVLLQPPATVTVHLLLPTSALAHVWSWACTTSSSSSTSCSQSSLPSLASPLLGSPFLSIALPLHLWGRNIPIAGSGGRSESFLPMSMTCWRLLPVLTRLTHTVLLQPPATVTVHLLLPTSAPAHVWSWACTTSSSSSTSCSQTSLPSLGSPLLESPFLSIALPLQLYLSLTGQCLKEMVAGFSQALKWKAMCVGGNGGKARKEKTKKKKMGKNGNWRGLSLV